MNMSDAIEKLLLEMIKEAGGSIEIQRNNLAGELNCVPSQINYVIQTRFTPERGYIIESRRGGGGYIRIRRVHVNRSSAIMHLINSIGSRLDALSSRILIENCLQNGIIDRSASILIMAAVSDNTLICLPVEYRDVARAAVMKQMLLSQI